ncbi:MAG: hypothetical protein H6842_10890 [Rhodospirillaceae bacterium]|nr:hypothetical protein [Rhodospirillaceae bacterium]
MSGTHVVLNYTAGTLKTMDAGAVAERIRTVLSERWPDLSVDLVDSAGIGPALSALRDRRPAVVIAGGGDGTVRGVVETFAGTATAVGVLPLGTMNLVARDLRMPLELEDAIAALRDAREDRIDVGVANGRIFVNHISFGIHPWVIRQRERYTINSKLAKKLATLRAFLRAWWRLPRIRLGITADGQTRWVTSSLLFVACNRFGDGAGIPPVRDDLRGGRLGIYLAKPESRMGLLRLGAEVAAGGWNTSSQFDAMRSPDCEIKGRRSKITAAMDGEIVRLTSPVRCRIEPDHLTVLMAAGAQGG